MYGDGNFYEASTAGYTMLLNSNKQLLSKSTWDNISMKSFCFVISLLFCFIFNLSKPVYCVEVARFGKRIQPDGFLIEWSGKTVHNWDNQRVWYWDAINTPDGIAGYIRSNKSVPCSSWTFIIEPSGKGKPLVMKVPPEVSNKNAVYNMDLQLYTDSSKVVFEWVIPWNRTDLDANQQYAIDIRGRSVCGDILPPLIINGSKDPPVRLITPKLIFQSVFIIILLTLYIIIRIKIRKKTRRKGLPHREA